MPLSLMLCPASELAILNARRGFNELPFFQGPRLAVG
jgi:hypothetical protein